MPETDGPLAAKPLQSLDAGHGFDEPWQAEALAIVDILIKQGLFSATTWSATLGVVLSAADGHGEQDNLDTYYRSVILALEKLIAKHSDIDNDAMSAKRKEWEDAYRSTPHGHPVTLKN